MQTFKIEMQSYEGSVVHVALTEPTVSWAKYSCAELDRVAEEVRETLAKSGVFLPRTTRSPRVFQSGQALEILDV